jgi:hypothetical protein
MKDRLARQYLEQGNALANEFMRTSERKDEIEGNSFLGMQTAAVCVLRQEMINVHHVDLHDPTPVRSRFASALFNLSKPKLNFGSAFNAVDELIESAKHDAGQVSKEFDEYTARGEPELAVLRDLHKRHSIHAMRMTAARFWMTWNCCKIEEGMPIAVSMALTNSCLLMSQIRRHQLLDCARYFRGTFFPGGQDVQLDLTN